VYVILCLFIFLFLLQEQGGFLEDGGEAAKLFGVLISNVVCLLAFNLHVCSGYL